MKSFILNRISRTVLLSMGLSLGLGAQAATPVASVAQSTADMQNSTPRLNLQVAQMVSLLWLMIMLS